MGPLPDPECTPAEQRRVSRKCQTSWSPRAQAAARDTDWVSPAVVASLLAVLVVGTTSLWVLADARARLEVGRPVTATIGGVTVDRPEIWAALCLLVVVLFLPLYLVARSAD